MYVPTHHVGTCTLTENLHSPPPSLPPPPPHSLIPLARPSCPFIPPFYVLFFFLVPHPQIIFFFKPLLPPSQIVTYLTLHTTYTYTVQIIGLGLFFIFIFYFKLFSFFLSLFLFLLLLTSTSRLFPLPFFFLPLFPFPCSPQHERTRPIRQRC